MEVTFWGCRGSVPVSGPHYIRHGGATTCIEVAIAGQDPSTPRTVVLDCGSGLASLGRSWGPRPPSALVLVSHMHWDHIQGFPFFGPLFRPDGAFTFVSVPRQGQTLRQVLAGQMTRPTFPVGLDIVPAELQFREVADVGSARFGALQVRWCRASHPGGCTAWRLDHGGASVVFTGDVECDGTVPDEIVGLAEGADLLIMDSQYLPEEIAGRRGFGHSTPLEAAAVGVAAGVGRLVLTHHDPSHTDATLDRKLALARACAPRLQIDNAHEGLSLGLAAAPGHDDLFGARL